MIPVQLLLLVAAAAVPQADPAAEGAKALEKQDYPAAIRLFTEAVTKDPQDYYSQFSLGLAYTGTNEIPKAVAAYRKTLAISPKLYEAELNLGILLTASGEAAEAAALLADAAAQKPKEFRPAISLAEARFAANQFDQAAEAYQAAIDLDPKSAASALGLARCFVRQKQLERALPWYRKAAELDARYRDAAFEAGQDLEKGGQLEAAIALYRELPQSALAQARLGQILLDRNQPGDAIAPLEFAASQSPDPAIRNALLEAAVRAKQPDKALGIVDRLIAAQPRDPENYLLRGRLLRDQRKFAEAAASFYAVTKLKPDHVEAWNEFAAMLISLERYDQAIAAFDRLRELNAERPPHFFFRAIIYDKLKQPKPALEAYRKFLEQAGGKYPDQEFQARQRARIIEKELSKR